MDKHEMQYAIAKQLPSAYEIRSNYGSMPLDDELRRAVEEALTPILEQRLRTPEKTEKPLASIPTVKDFLSVKKSNGPGFFDRMLQEQKFGNSESVDHFPDAGEMVGDHNGDANNMAQDNGKEG